MFFLATTRKTGGKEYCYRSFIENKRVSRQPNRSGTYSGRIAPRFQAFSMTDQISAPCGNSAG